MAGVQLLAHSQAIQGVLPEDNFKEPTLEDAYF